MFEDFFHQIEKELGPLNSDWFEELSAKAEKNGHCPDAVEKATSSHKDGRLRAPVETPILESPMSSTPRIFRNGGTQYPESSLGQSPDPGNQTPLSVLPWTDSSPFLFGPAKESERFEKECESLKRNNCFGLLDTPKSSLAQDASAKRISESLGAQLNPDLSWSSSFNTPSAMSPTVILSKQEAQSTPVSLFKDKEVIIVRNLFPSLSKGSECESTSTAKHNATNGAVQDRHKSYGSFDNMDSLWRQTVPDAIRDGDVRNTVESVLDGAEDVLSIFFSNSDSALRRVKTKGRTKKRVNGLSKDVKSAEHSTDQTIGSKVECEERSSDNCATQKNSPLKSKDFSQWTPLGLSEVPSVKAKQGCPSELAHTDLVSVNSDSEHHVLPIQFFSCAAEKKKGFPDLYPEKSQLRSSLLAASPSLTFSRKPRRFVYQVQSPSLSNTGGNQNATPDRSSPSSADKLTDIRCEESSLCDESKHNEDDTCTADTSDTFGKGEAALKQVNPSGLNMDHGLDMTQLCKAFAEDFTQEENLEKAPRKSTESCHSDLIMSSCLTRTTEMGKVQFEAESEKQCDRTDLQCNHKETSSFVMEAVNFTHVPRTESIISESSKHDCDCSAIISNFSQAKSTCVELHVHPGFKIINNNISVPTDAVKNAKASEDLEEQQLMTDVVSLQNTEPEMTLQRIVLARPASAELPSERRDHGLKSGEESADFVLDGSPGVCAARVPSSSLLQSYESGFRTASNRSITVTSVNLEKAKDIFKQLEEENSDLCPSSAGELEVQNLKNSRLPKFDFKSNHSAHNNVEGNCFLTASQKADVTELCSMLEDGDSQYEFTQFRQTKLGSKLLDNKDWDSDILSGIDFDDSFNCDAEGQVSRKFHMKPDMPNQHTPVPNSMQNGALFIQSVNISKACHVPQETPNAILSLTDDCLTLRSDGKELTKALIVQTNSKEGKKSSVVGFKTARGNSVCVSEKYLSKGKTLFANLEDCQENFGPKYDHRKVADVKNQKQLGDHCATGHSHAACSDELIHPMKKSELHPNCEESLSNGNTYFVPNEAAPCEPACKTTNLETAQGDVDQKPDLIESNTVSFGFSTAAGKEVKVSEKSLQKAKKLLNEVAKSEEAPVMYEAAVSSIKASPTTKAVSLTKTSACNSSKLLAGEQCFSKMSGETCPKDTSEQNSENSTEVRWKMSQYHIPQSLQGNGFKLASGKGVSLSASAVEKWKTFFKDIDGCVDAADETKSKEECSNMDLEAERSHNGSKVASGKGASYSEKAFAKSKAIFKDCNLDCSDSSQGKGDDPSVMYCSGFKAVAGNAAHLPEIDSLNKEAASLKEEPTVLNKYVKKEFTKTSAVILQSTSGCGFSTASGKMVSVSAEALHRAKAVFDESTDVSPCEKIMETSHEKSIPKTETVVQERSWGFSTAGGRKVTVSDKALEEAKDLFSGCELECPAPHGGLITHAKTSQVDPEQICGFSTASGKGVVVSEKAVNEVKTVFAGCDDILANSPEIERLTLQKTQQESSCTIGLRSHSMSVPTTAGKSEIIMVENSLDNFGAKGFGFSTASGKGVSVSKSALQAAFNMLKDCDVQPVPESQGHIIKTESLKLFEKCRPAVLESDQIGQSRDTALSSQAIQADSALLTCHSLNLNGCTMTQQKYFEQEAMACTRALLEDDLHEHSLLGTLEDTDFSKPPVLLQRSSFGATGERKRMIDGDLTGQPPLKRRLVSEFDQISDGSRVCTPVKTSPNGILKDRRVFKYTLKPNITYPSRNGNDQKMSIPDVQTTFSSSGGQNRRPSDPKAVVFVPPFPKNLKSEMHKNSLRTDEAKVPSVFIPPFKKDISLSQKGSFDSRSLFISSSVSEKKISTLNVIPHTAGKRDHEETKKEKGAEEDSQLGDGNTVTCEDNGLFAETCHQSLDLARDMQDMRIRKKNRQTIKPLPGSFYLAKTSGVTKISLREAVRYNYPLPHTQQELYQYGVHCSVSQVTAENAESFRFNFDDFFRREAFIENAGVQLADGGWLIPDNKRTVGKEEFYRTLCDTPGVDPKLLSKEWGFNHYRWIVWKQACMERAFPEVMGCRCLTPEQVLLQLKFRYDLEVDNTRRSALKKVIERDGSPAKTLVLCVCGIAKFDQSEMTTSDTITEMPTLTIWLSDGWYSIKALLDPPLSAVLQKGRLRVGDKLMTHGAELIGSQDACSPLEAPDALMLKISANSTRRVRWDTKLGFHKDPRPFKLLLSSLYPNGGVVGCVDIIVLRSYPIQWMEKKSGGVFVFRNERAEDREARRHSSIKQKTMEHLISKIQAEYEKEDEEIKKTRRRRRFRRHEIEKLQDGEKLYEAIESDPSYVEAHLSAGQVEAVSRYRRNVAERRQAEVQERVHRALQEAEGGCSSRDITPVWKLAIADFRDLHRTCVYTLNIWRPSAELQSILREGGRYKTYHLATSETKKRSDTASIQFTATKKTLFQDIEVCPKWLSTHFPARRLCSFRDLQNPEFSSPCGEVDVVGCVISILDKQGPSPVLYLVDDKFDFISVRSFSSLVQLALEDLVKPLALLAISNLQLRELSGPVPRLYAGEQVLFSLNPKDVHLKEAVAHLTSFVKNYEHFSIVAEEKLSNLIPSGNLKSVQSQRTLGLQSMPKPNGRIHVTPQQSRVFSPFTPVSKRIPATTVQTSEAKDPKSVKRKRGIDYLARVPSPPPLSPLSIVTSPSVKKTFNPPRRSGTPQPTRTGSTLSPRPVSPAVEEQWVNDEELAMINTQTLL